ncbi:RNA-directed DNA polymerase, eukaryota [Tanacetum coccineum]
MIPIVKSKNLDSTGEGFPDVKLTYLGGLWIMMEFSSLISKEKFLQHVGVASWFNSLSNAQPDFVSKERIVWVDIEGVPLHLWSHSTFTKIGSKWGELLELEESKDDIFARKRLCIKTKQEDNILEKFKIIHCGKVFVIRAKELFAWVLIFQEDKRHDGRDEQQQHQPNHMKPVSEDPFQVYDLLQKKDNKVKSGLEQSRTYPPGFTPDVDENKKVEDKASSPFVGLNSRVMPESSPIEDQMSNQGYSYMNVNKKGGSILEVVDDMIQLGRTIGYTMEGCMKDLENIIGTQGVNDVFK